MGHIRLGVLPKTYKWRQVVAKLGAGDNADAVAQAALVAAEDNLRRASQDPAFLESFWLLTQLPIAARTGLRLGCENFRSFASRQSEPDADRFRNCGGGGQKKQRRAN
jgi:hypothetical protein